MENTVTISIKEYEALRGLKKNYDKKVAELNEEAKCIFIYWHSRKCIEVKNIQDAIKETLNLLQEDTIRIIQNASFWARLKYLFTRDLDK